MNSVKNEQCITSMVRSSGIGMQSIDSIANDFLSLSLRTRCLRALYLCEYRLLPLKAGSLDTCAFHLQARGFDRLWKKQSIRSLLKSDLSSACTYPNSYNSLQNSPLPLPHKLVFDCQEITLHNAQIDPPARLLSSLSLRSIGQHHLSL